MVCTWQMTAPYSFSGLTRYRLFDKLRNLLIETWAAADDLAEAKERWEQQLGTSHSGGTTATSGVSGDGGIISVVER